MTRKWLKLSVFSAVVIPAPGSADLAHWQTLIRLSGAEVREQVVGHQYGKTRQPENVVVLVP